MSLLNVNKYIALLIIVISLTACKSSPTTDNADESVVVSTTSVNEPAVSGTQGAVTANSEEPVTSTANTENGPSADIPDYIVNSGEFNHFPREISGWDETGWSIVVPSEDSRLIYVSSSVGDDETAEFYAPRDISDLQNPGQIKPFKTIHAAIDQTRKGFPDWILLRRGDQWEVAARAELKAGRSIDERSVFTSYGQSPDRPVISRSDGREMLRIWSNRNYVAVLGISFYAEERDPQSASFAGWGNVGDVDGILIYGPEGIKMGSILIEDNHFNYLSKGVSIDGKAEHVDIVIRRNIITNSYSESGHAQGMGATTASALLEENIFDHNGWLVQQRVEGGKEEAEGQATIYNHNTYFRRAVDTVFRNNIFLRPSSIHNKWTANPTVKGVDEIGSSNLLMENNLYVGGEIGISAGGNDDYDTGHRWSNIRIIDNVMLAIGRDRPTNRNLAWYIDAIDWDGGDICGNYLLKNDNPLVQNINGIKVNGHSRDVTVSKNILYDLYMSQPSNNNGALRMNDEPKSNILIKDNSIQLAGSEMRPVISENLPSTRFENNTYYTDADNDQWFRVNGGNYSFDEWESLSGDFESLNERQSYIEPERTFETYLDSIGFGSSIDAFVRSAMDQPTRTWSENFSAERINAYIREGYGNTTCN